MFVAGGTLLSPYRPYNLPGSIAKPLLPSPKKRKWIKNISTVGQARQKGQNIHTMAELRIRIELNKGRIGMPLDKLAAITEDLVKFLNSLTHDLRLVDGEPVWLAERFDNNSVDFDAHLAAVLDEEDAEEGRGALRYVFGDAKADPIYAFKVTPGTRSQFRKMTAHLDPDELIRFNVIGEEALPEGPWYDISPVKEPLDAVDTMPRKIYGEIQGVITAFFKDKGYHLRVRDLSTGRLVKCAFSDSMYGQILEALENPDSVVFVEGYIHEDPETGDTDEIQAEGILIAPSYSSELIDQFLGTIPDYTGTMTTEQHLERFRERCEASGLP
jgi:hypothetical protein